MAARKAARPKAKSNKATVAPRASGGKARGPGTDRVAATLASILNVADAEAIARRKLSRAFFDYYAGGAEDEQTLARNRSAMDRYVLLHRVLVDVSHTELSTTFLGERV